MQIVRFSHKDDPAYGVIDGEEIVVLRSDPLFDSYNTTGERVPLEGQRLLSPMIPRSKVIGFGSNYVGAPFDERPEVLPWFVKPNTSVVGPDDPVVVPPYADGVLFEAELAIVISRIARFVPAEQASRVIFGYTVANDFGVRDHVGNDWLRAKAWDTSQPIGPWIETDLDVAAGLAVRSWVDGEPAQEGSTADLHYSVGELVEQASSVMTLLPGDVILTGTPAGASVVRPGQRVEVEVEGIGRFGNPVMKR